MGRKWKAVIQSVKKERISFDISEDLYQKLCEDIQKGVHFVDDPEAFKKLNSCCDSFLHPPHQ